jgi:hypothetical protein
MIKTHNKKQLASREPIPDRKENKMAMKFIEAQNRKELLRKINLNNYTIIKKVTNGYACFEYYNDYEIWKKQK